MIQTQPLEEALSVIRQIHADTMSGGETDDEEEAAQGSDKEGKAIHRIPVCWLNPQVVHRLHADKTWILFLVDEKLAKGEDLDCCGNRPLQTIPQDKPAVVGRIT